MQRPHSKDYSYKPKLTFIAEGWKPPSSAVPPWGHAKISRVQRMAGSVKLHCGAV